MRLKKVPGARAKIEASSYLILEPQQYRGHVQDIFGNHQPIYLEIGMGKGKFLQEQARRHPDRNYLGIEKYDSVLVRAIEALADQSLPNLRFICFDALQVDQLFDHEITALYLNFSDPWPKKRHQERRLTSPTFLARYENIFIGEPVIIMKTDNRFLFEYSLKTLTDFNYHFDELSLNLYEDQPSDNIPTEYEEKWRAKGATIYRLKVHRPLDRN